MRSVPKRDGIGLYRRDLLRFLVATTTLATGGPLYAETLAQPTPEPPQEQPFSFDTLTAEMKTRAARSYVAPKQVGPDLSYDDYQRIQFRHDHARWREKGSLFQLEAYHLGGFFKTPVQVYEVADGTAKQIAFQQEDFHFYDGMTVELPKTGSLPGVAGIRLNTPLNRPDKFDELVSFLGANYFRALGRGNVYGLSARGVTVNTAISGSEEFPAFDAFYLERPPALTNQITFFAALDSPSLTGAYRFIVTPGETTTMEVTARLFLRKDIEQLGVAPLTSMYLYGANDPGAFNDFRPEVHDSDGLVMDDGGDRIYWRPLNNPPQLSSSYLAAENPRSFGLMQRNREWEAYLDAQARYQDRPSLLVEPQGDWGKGMVRLVEIPTDYETNDNIVAFWVPQAPAKAGDALTFAYRLSWGSLPMSSGQTLARVLRTRTGHGGNAQSKPKKNQRKFVIDFDGGELGNLEPEAVDDLKATVSATKAKLENQTLSKIEGTKTWRLVFDITADSGAIVEMSAVIEGYGRTLTETWLDQWIKG